MRLIRQAIPLLLLAAFTWLAGCRQAPPVPQPTAVLEIATATSTTVRQEPSPIPSPSATLLPVETAVPTLTPGESGEPAINEAQLVRNLVALSRLFGYVRYFHPSDQATSADVNWSRVASGGVAAVADAATPAELAERLQSYFRPLAPTLQVFALVAEPPSLPADLSPPPGADDLQVVMWEHFGVAGESPTIYESKRQRQAAPGGEIPAGFHDPGQPYYAELGAGVAARIPLALFVDSGGTLPPSQEPPSDRGMRLPASARYPAGVIVAWNVFQHFYPYFDVVETEWDRVLVDRLTAALAAKNDADYEEVLWALLAELDDGHGYVLAEDPYFAPFVLDWIEGQLVVVYVSGEAAGQMQPGNVVLTIDGRPAAELLLATMSRVPAATEQVRWRIALRRLLSGPRSSQISLEIETVTGERRELSLRRTGQYLDMEKIHLEPITELEPGIFYVDFTRINDQEFEAALPALTTATGLLFDMRGYPSRVTLEPLRHLIATPVDSQQHLVPVTIWPDRKNVQFHDADWTLTPKEPFLAARKVFLINGRAMSYAETWLGIVDYYGVAEALVGEGTAGTNGNRNVFTVPGNRFIYWTGMKVLRQDGTQFHGIGVQPTHPVGRTRQGVVEGRDEQVEAALELLRR
jgi:C-terminal processing protease CtpA/Prc